jgi:hypothetical protein
MMPQILSVIQKIGRKTDFTGCFTIKEFQLVRYGEVGANLLFNN